MQVHARVKPKPDVSCSHRVAEVGMDLWRSSSPTSYSIKSSRKGCSRGIQLNFEYLQGLRPIASLGSLWKKVKSESYVEEKFPAFLFVPIVICPVSGHHWKELGSIFFIPFHQVFIHIDKILPRLLFSRLNRHSFLSVLQMFWSLNHRFGLSSDSCAGENKSSPNT